VRGDARLADADSDTCLARVWRSTHFSWWMTTMLHRTAGADAMEAALQLSQLRYVTTSRAAAVTLAENYDGYPPLLRPRRAARTP
jgi:p-hydroxybenzoate 3-monooxygenase